jgi:hypothetical protein
VGPAGRSGSRTLADQLVRQRLAHVLASDAHGTGPQLRTGMSEGAAAVAAISPALASWMTSVAPAAILTGLPLETVGEVARDG